MLMCAVILQAVRDYRRALRQYNTSKHKERDIENTKVINECEVFFRESIGSHSSIDGEKIISKIKYDTEEALNKKGIIMEVPEE